MSKRDDRRKAQGEVVGGGYIVFRRGKKWGRVRITGKDWMKFFQPFEWPTEDAALLEAERLAKKHPGEKFCVFQQVAARKETVNE